MARRPPLILLVEDDADDVLLLQRALQACDEDPLLHVLNDGRQAISYLQEPDADGGDTGPPSLLLIDLKLPGKTGFEVIEWVRGQTEYQALPVVVFSSSSQPQDMDRAYAAGANSFIMKPVGFSRLTATIGDIVRYWTVLNQVPSP